MIGYQFMTNGKACEYDSIHAEMFKADVEMTSHILFQFFKRIWTDGVVPSDCMFKGSYCQNSEKGKLENFDKWKGTTLLSLPSIVSIRVLFNRLYEVAEHNDILREKQADFRKGKSCIDQIFALRNVNEQSISGMHPCLLT